MPKQKILSNKKIKIFLSELPAEFSQHLPRKANYVIKQVNNLEILFLNKKPYFFKENELWVPTLYSLKDLNLDLKRVTVDKGAIHFIANGADVMRPGITELDDFKENELVQIIDENNKVALAVGKALFDSNKIKNLNSGKVVKTLHYVGDFIWKLV
ncbi:MAG: hypothetical protein PWP03_175 [Candidatus Woesearchaeota archaeon]|nr:hypothetical protein [Candidatus Woesearchaeota archaeon]MDN5327537.1 hypothetical protein [Candidatus Woesearchaeota archaeon]